MATMPLVSETGVSLIIQATAAVNEFGVVLKITDAARQLGLTLINLAQFEEAEEVLTFSHRILMRSVSETFNTHDQQQAGLKLLEEFKHRATGLLRARGKTARAESLSMYSNIGSYSASNGLH